MTTIAIIDRTQNHQTDLIFRGAYGTVVKAAQRVLDGATVEDNQPTPVIFQIAPELTGISAVFGYLDGNGEQSTLEELRMIDVPEAQAEQVKDQLMLALRTRWAGLYETHAHGSAMVVNIIKSEARNVDAAIERHFAQRQTQAWSVPVTATMRASIDGSYYGSKSELLDALKTCRAESTIAVDPTQAVTPFAPPAAGQVTAGAPQADVDGEAQSEVATQDSYWSEFYGIEAEVKGTVVVMGRSEAEAVQNLEFMLTQRTNDVNVFNPTLVPSDIVAVRPMTPTDPVADADDSQQDPGEDEDFDGEGRPAADRG